MSGPLNSVRLIGKYWGTVGLLTSSRAQKSLTEVESGSYGFEKFALDAFGFWDDAIGSWITIFNDPDNTDLTPTLPISVPYTVDSVTGSLALGLQTSTKFDPSQDLVKSGAKNIPGPTSVFPSVTASGDLQIVLKNLAAVAVTGLYTGPVSAGGVVIATIRLHVT